MCRVLEVSESGYYAWRRREPGLRAAADTALVAEIRQVHAASRATYGSRRITAALGQQGQTVNHKRVERLMRLHGLRGCDRRKRRPVTTQADPRSPVAENLLARDFSAEAPNQKWLGDISYVETWEGFLYLAGLEDVFSRKVVGWAMANTLETTLVERALDMALTRRDPPAGLLQHTDRGRPVRQPPLPGRPGSSGHPAQHEPRRRLLRQRHDGELLRHPQGGMRLPTLCHPGPGPHRSFRLHRGLLQPPAPAFRPGLSQP